MLKFEQQLCDIVGVNNIFLDEDMSKHSYIKVGGTAKFFVLPKTCEQIEQIVKLCNEKKVGFCVIGECSNTMFKASGYKGVVIKLADNFTGLERQGNLLIVKSGVRLNAINKFCVKEGLSGLENLFMIPGSIGGAVFMNAGAYGDEIGKHVESVKYLMDGVVGEFSAEECRFGYRDSIFQHMENVIILSVKIKFTEKKGESVKRKIVEIMKHKLANQPYELPSLGSVFKRKFNVIPAKIIDELGLKGKKIGGAVVSKKHSGFIVNDGTATAKDVLKLIDFIREKVYNNYNVFLETEIKIMGDK